jgi:hypothetical protein
MENLSVCMSVCAYKDEGEMVIHTARCGVVRWTPCLAASMTFLLGARIELVAACLWEHLLPPTRLRTILNINSSHDVC